MNKIIEIVNQVLEEEFEIDADLLKPESLLYEDIGLDSLDAVDLIVMVDKQLGVRIDEEQARSIRTLEDVYNTIDELLKEKQ
ncbi:MAG: acyl carrier protein [Proteobacteria bacterium]|nr:acyl carrier protein [Pseudomonadota bacterium]MBU1585011.1 acyl carrier protein [Pseudomonadota bacterium]MBU2454356.1 acyl carrier protein [Pseudomonadota bacterium]MBU2628785.1 acyl carrier protein [Pseudomonadota bacterium]